MQVEISGVKFETPIYNAAGCHCTTEQHLDDLTASGAGAVMTKSCTLNARDGNEHPKYWENQPMTINSNGLENMGYEWYLDYYGRTERSKPAVISVAGLTLEENFEIILAAAACEAVDMIELNLSCPNLAGHTPVSYDMECFETYLSQLVPLSVDTPLGLKLPPYFMSGQFEQVGKLVERYGVDFISCINSMPKGLVYKWDVNGQCEPAIKNKLGGIGGGDFMKAISLSNVYQFDKHVNVPIIMCGGIRSGRDCYEGRMAGASLFQVGSQLMLEGPGIFDRLNAELAEVLEGSAVLAAAEE